MVCMVNAFDVVLFLTSLPWLETHMAAMRSITHAYCDASAVVSLQHATYFKCF